MTVPEKRPRVLRGPTYEIETGCGSIYITITEKDGKPFEIFARLGKAGGCASAQTEAIGRLASLALRSGINPEEVVKHLCGIQCDRKRISVSEAILSCADAIGKALKAFLQEKEEKE